LAFRRDAIKLIQIKKGCNASIKEIKEIRRFLEDFCPPGVVVELMKVTKIGGRLDYESEVIR